MTAFKALARLAASTSLVTAVACADNVTQGKGLDPAGADANQPAAAVGSATAKPATLVATSTGGASFFHFGIRGADFPIGASYSERLIAVFHDGHVTTIGAGLGVNPADGSFRSEYTGNFCPSGITDVHAIVISGGKTTESNHVAPLC